jgi:putative FmdB family regulatory protein
MAIYEYRCEKCGKVVEEMTLTLDGGKDSIECPDCKNTAPKIMSGGCFVVLGFNKTNGYSGNMR